MNTMVRPLSATTFFIVLLQHIQGYTASNEIHTCQVLSIQPDTSKTDLHRKLLKLDFIRLTATSDTNIVGNDPYPTSPTDVPSSITKWSGDRGRTPVPPDSSRQNKANADVTTLHTVTQSTAFPGEGSNNCMCQVDSKTTTRISAVQVMSDTQDESLLLQVRQLNATKAITVNKAWHQTFNDTTVTFFVANNESMQSYSLVIEVEGNFTSITCTQSAAVHGVGKTGVVEAGHNDKAIKANSELLFEMPLLVIGGVLAVVGFLFITAGVAVWRRYRSQRRKQHKKSEKIKLKNLPSNYYEVSNDDCEHSSTESKTEIKDSSRKASMSSTSKMKHKQDNPSSSGQQFLDVDDCPGMNGGDQKPSPGTMRYQRSFDRRKKKQELKMSKDKKNKSKNVDNVEDETYSSVLEEYKDVSPEKPYSPTKKDIRIATPLVHIHCSGLQPSFPLRKTGNLNHSQTRAKIVPKCEPSVQEDTYSHLNRSNKSHSCHINQAATYDSLNIYSLADETDRCKSTYADEKNSNGFNFSKQTSDEPSVLTGNAAKDDEKRTSSSSNQEDQNHIYEAVEKVETLSVYMKQSSQCNTKFTEEPNKDKANSSVENMAKREQGTNKEIITDISQSERVDITDPYQTTVNKDVFLYDVAGPLDTAVTTDDAVDKINLQSAEDARADENRQISPVLGERRRLSEVNEILTKSPSIDGHCTDFHKKPNEVQRDFMNCTQSLAINDCEDLHNGSAHVLLEHTLEGSGASSQSDTDNED